MARPSRCRRICLEPEYDSFAPCGKESAEPVLLTVDEFETIRLIDYERQTHEQCARQMGVSRTTVTEMYERARGKLAHCLVNGRPLRIAGGNYKPATADAAGTAKNSTPQPETGQKGSIYYENRSYL